MKLKNRVAVVTGGGQGLGQQIAIRLAKDRRLSLLTSTREVLEKPPT